MPKSENQKLKLLYIRDMLLQETDENHGLTTADIISRLAALDIKADRKTIYTDLEDLRVYGMDIIQNKVGKQTLYSVGSRDFELAELKLLVDSVQSSRFITEKKSRSLIKKLEGLVSRYDAGELHRGVVITGRIKTMNESIYYNVDKLHGAINTDRKIKFRYFNYGMDKKEVFRRGGDWYCVSPWHLRWDDENYYLFAFDSEAGIIKHYRVDKMKNLTVTDISRDGIELMNSLDPAQYSETLFSMYSGEIQRVKMRGDVDIVGVLIDRFGKDIQIIPVDDSHFETTVNVAVSPQFSGWVASLEGKLEIISPDSVRGQMLRFCEKLAEQYRKG